MALYSFYCFLIYFSFGYCQTDTQVQTLEAQIVGGQSVSIESYPYQVSLLLNDNPRCGGAIVASQYVVTAAHCVVGYTAASFTIRAGSSYLGNGGFTRNLTSIVTHPNYNAKTVDYDVAVLKLKSKLSYTNAINKIVMSQTTPAARSVAVVSGWGATRTGGAATYQLQAVQVPIVNQLSCTIRYGLVNLITARMVCAGYLFVGGKDSCQGDSGGPLAYMGNLVGLVSWNSGSCGSGWYPGVYASIPNLYNWIKQYVVFDV